MRLDITTGEWKTDPAAAAGFHTFGTYVRNETVPLSGGQSLGESWQVVTGSLDAVGWGRFVQLQLSGGPGRAFIDNTFIGANLTKAEAAALGRV